MSAKFRMHSHNVLIIFFITLLAFILSFIVFWINVLPYGGSRMVENLGEIAGRIIPFALTAVGVITAAGALLLWASSVRSFIAPLKRLKLAAAQIRDNNLDYELIVKGNDEFAELARSFEEMRIQLKNSRIEKEAAETERNLMMASICHDLKTPVTSLLGYAEGILDGVADTPERVQDYIRVIRKKALSMQQMTNDLSLLSKLETAQLELEKKRTDIGALTCEIAAEYADAVPGITIAYEVKNGLICELDRERFGRVMINLLENSVKYKKPEDEAPSLTITATEADGNALLTITDNGIGISDSDMPHIFKSFYRADTSRSMVKGSGLGLSIVREIINLHGGKTWMRAPKSGGLTVCILIPLTITDGKGVKR